MEFEYAFSQFNMIAWNEINNFSRSNDVIYKNLYLMSLPLLKYKISKKISFVLCPLTVKRLITFVVLGTFNEKFAKTEFSRLSIIF